MVTKDLRKLLNKLNDHTTRALEAAAGFSVSRGHYEVTVEHLLAKLLEDGGGDILPILRHFDVDPGDVWDRLLLYLEGGRTGNTGRPSFSPKLLQLVESAWLVATVHHESGEIRSGHLLEALLDNEAMRAEAYVDAMSAVERDTLRQRFMDLVAGSSENRAATGSRPMLRTDGPAREGETALDLYTLDVTGRARDGKIDPVFGRDKEIRQIIDILSRRRKNNPILVGEAGVGKTAVVEGLALRLAEGDVPDSLREVEIRTLDLGLLQAGAGVKGEFENRLKSVIQEVREAAKPTILFIDEAHTLIGAGGAAGTADAANLLKPALARGELRTLAATTWSEYKKYIEKDPALERRFQLVKIEEPSVADAAIMLRGIKTKYEQHHGVRITDAAVRAAAELSERYISGRQLPDKAVDLLDTAAARVKMSQTAIPAQLDDLTRRIQYLDTEITAFRSDLGAGVRDDADTIDVLQADRVALEEARTSLRARWDAEKALAMQINAARDVLMPLVGVEGDGAGRPAASLDSPEGDGVGVEGDGAAEQNVAMPAAAGASEEAAGETAAPTADPGTETAGDREVLKGLQRQLGELQDGDPMVHAEVNEHIAAQVIADWTGIPLGNMLKDEADVLLSLENRLGERILGQNEALVDTAETIRTAKAGLGNPDAPIGVFLFVGPSGTGKTETALSLADMLFGGERFVTTINMSEYQESHTVSQLKGSPPGYVGYGEGGVLTEAVRQRPYSVVLLDEVEKAHRDVMNLFYQVFDKGFMRDGEGREINFKNTIIIMTSNLASDIITYVTGDEERPTPDQIREATHQVLAEHFQPALLARMKVVPFYTLDKKTMSGIVRLKLGKVGRRLVSAHGISFEYAPEVVDQIAERCTQVDAGARNVDFIIDRNVLPEASRALIGRLAAEDVPERLHLGLDEQGEFVFTFS